MSTQLLKRLRSRQAWYLLLSRATSDPFRPAGWAPLLDPAVQKTIVEAVRELPYAAGDPDEALAPGEIDPGELDLENLLGLLSERGLPGIREEHRALYGLLTPKDCPPYETDYCPQTFSVYRSQQMADVAGYYSAFGVAPSSRKPERADHISLELEFMGWLVAKEALASSQADKERVLICQEAQSSFMEKHLCWWIPAFAKALRDKAQTVSQGCPFYGELGHVLPAFVCAERRQLGIAPPDRLVAPTPEEDPGPMNCSDCASEFAGQGVFSRL